MCLMMPPRVFAVMILTMLPFSVAGAEETFNLQAVYEAAQAGQLEQARRMVDTLIADNPSDAKAHFVKADVCASLRDLECVRTQLKSAKSLDASLGFASPEAVMDLETLADGRPAAQPGSRSEFTKGWFMAALAVATLLAWALFKRKGAGSTRTGKNA